MSFSNNIWWTRKARIQAEKRLLSNAFQSQLLLLWYTFFGVAVSIYYLKLSDNNDLAGVTWVIYSVLCLSISGFIAGLSFKERAALIKESYETLQVLYLKANSIKESNESSEVCVNSHDKSLLANEYSSVMGLCENHTDFDYYKALCIEYLTAQDKTKLDRAPVTYHWVSLGFWMVRRYTMLLAFYLLPLVIFIGLEILKCQQN